MSRKGDLDRDAFFKTILGDIGTPAEAGPETIEVDSIVFNPGQPRRHFAEQALAELAESIRTHGVLEPVLVRRRDGGFELIAGERRTRAARLAGLTQVPAIILDVPDNEALEISIMENLQREDLNAVEETDAVLRLLELQLKMPRTAVVEVLQEIYNEERGRRATRRHGEDVQEELRQIFARLGRFTPGSFFVNRVPILEFPEELLEAVRSGQLTFTKAQALARVPTARTRNRLLKEAIASDLSLSEIRARIKAETGGSKGAVGKTDPGLAQTRSLLRAARVARLPAARQEKLRKLLKEIRALFEE